MKTTLTPPLSADEKRMIAEFVGCYYGTYPKATAIDAFNEAESLLTEFRSRYGVVGEAESHPEKVTWDNVVNKLIPENQRLREALEKIVNAPLPYNEMEAYAMFGGAKITAREALKGGKP